MIKKSSHLIEINSQTLYRYPFKFHMLSSLHPHILTSSQRPYQLKIIPFLWTLTSEFLSYFNDCEILLTHTAISISPTIASDSEHTPSTYDSSNEIKRIYFYYPAIDVILKCTTPIALLAVASSIVHVLYYKPNSECSSPL